MKDQATNPENDFAKLGWYSGVLLQLKKESYFWIEGIKPASLSQIQDENETNTTELILGTEGFKLLKKDACVLFLGFHEISVELPNDDLSKDEDQEPVCVQRNVLKFLTDTAIVFLDYNSIANSNQTLANIFAICNKDFDHEPPQKT